MNILYLRADTEQNLIDALPFARGVDFDSNPIWIRTTHDFTLDIIGALSNDDATVDGNGEVVTQPAQKPGFHANLLCTDAIAATIPNEIIVIPPPTNIKRKWA